MKGVCKQFLCRCEIFLHNSVSKTKHTLMCVNNLTKCFFECKIIREGQLKDMY